MTYVDESLGRVYIDLKRLFLFTRPGYWYWISFLEENKSFINVEPLKFNYYAPAVFKKYKALHEKQSSSQLKIFHIDRRKKCMKNFEDYFEENSIGHKVTFFIYLSKANIKKELTALLLALFELLMLNVSLLSYYR